MWYSFVKGVLALWFRLQFGLRVEGREHEPPTGAVLAVSNHVSALDPPIAGVALRRRVWYMAKEELLRTPVLGPLLRSVGVFPVRRGEADRQSIRTALDILSRGRMLLMFPEGTRSVDGRLRPAEPGAALLALRTGAAVLPVAVIGTQRAMPKGARFPRRGPVTVRFGPPIQVPKHDGRITRQTLESWGSLFMAAIAELLPPEQQALAQGSLEASTEASLPSAGR
ncbi:MAG: lysophospholipid acyltransferase family protein [Armatimonadota bacterium]|nr:lysophospholipid acyltransferase family protein [Armatimonadota bacterium]